MGEIPLYVQYPAMLKFPIVKLGDFPTPVHRLSHFPHDNLWIKRDDLSSSLYGGNKIRKLEYTLAEAIALRKPKVVTMGGIGTNHGLATAIYCHALGLTCTLLLFNQPVTDYVKKNVLLFSRYNAELTYCKSVLNAGLLFYARKFFDNNAYCLYAGGSSHVGTIGFVNAAFELKQQVDAMQMPHPDYIVCPLGSAGTMAGLSLGVALAGLKSTVIGVRVADRGIGPVPIANEKSVASLIKRTYHLMKTAATIPAVDFSTPVIMHDYCGKGYGYSTASCIEAMEKMHNYEHIALEPTYTGKTFAAVCDMLSQSECKNKTILYWHTYNSANLDAEAEKADWRNVPKSLQWVFEK